MVQADRDAPSPRPGLRSAGLHLLIGALVVGFACVVFFRIGDAPVVHRREWRCYEPAQNMMETGSWLVPHYEGHVRLEKPPLYTWMVVGASWLHGRPTPATLRVPSAVAGVALAVLVAAWAYSAGGAVVAATAVGSYTLMGLIYKQARRGDAEVVYTLFSMLTLFLVDQVVRRGRRRLIPVIPVVLGLAFLGKATAALLVVGAPVGVWLAVERRLRDLLRLHVLACAGLAVAIGIAWYVAVLVVVPGAWDALYTALVIPLGLEGRTGGPVHLKPFYYYARTLTASALPAAFALPLVGWRAWTSRLWREEAAMRLPGLGFLAVVVGFSLVAEKQRHYVVPMLPLLALVTADSLVAFARERPTWFRRMLSPAGAAIAGLSTLSGGAVAFYLTAVLGHGAWAGGVAVGLGLAGAGAAFRAGRRGRVRVLAGTLAAVNLAVAGVGYDSLDVWRWSFMAGKATEQPGFDAHHWDTVFQRYSWMVRVLDAREYAAGIPHAAAPERGVE